MPTDFNKKYWFLDGTLWNYRPSDVEQWRLCRQPVGRAKSELRNVAPAGRPDIPIVKESKFSQRFYDLILDVVCLLSIFGARYLIFYTSKKKP